MSSEGKFFNKVKNAFKSEKGEKSSESSPQNSPRASRSSKSGPTTSDPKPVLAEAREEGAKTGKHHEQQQHGASTTAADSNYGGSGAYSHSKTGNDKHDNILKEAYEEGRKLFHHHSKTGNTGVQHGGTASAGAAAGGIGGYAAGSSYDHKSTVPDYSSKDGDVVSSSSKGRVVSSPPKRSREPLKYETPGDYSNAKNPTDSTVIAGGNGANQGDGFQDKGVYENSKPAYSDGAEPVQGHGKFFDPRDTQGGVLGAAVGSQGATNAYNQGKIDSSHQEATKARYVDEDKLKTKPAAYEQEDRQKEELEQIKQEAYKEGNKKGRKDVQEDPSLLGSRQIGGSGSTNDDKDINKKEIHQENKSAYNPGGVAGVLEKEHGQSLPANKRNLDHDNVIKTGGVVYGGPGVASASKENYDPAATDRKISDLDAQINQTDSKIQQLRHDPSNASTYAVRDEPIQTPKLSDVHDDDYEHLDSKVNETDRNTNDNAEKPGVFAGAGGALAAAAGYLGFGGSQQPEDKVKDDTYHQGEFTAIKEEIYGAGYKQGKDLYGPTSTTSTTGGSKGVSGVDAKDVESKAYGEGYHQGKNEPGFVDEAKQTVEGLVSATAGYLGYGATQGDSHPENKSSATSPEHKQILDSSYAAGQQKYENERAGKTTGQPGQEGFVERAEHAIGGAAAAAATYLGLDSSSTAHNATEGHQQLLKESYDAGKAKGEKDLASGGTNNQTGQSGWQEAKEVVGGTALAAAGAGVAATTYAADKLGYNDSNKTHNKSVEEEGSHRTTSTLPKDNKVENDNKGSSSNQGYLSSVGAAVGSAGAAVGNAVGYNQTPQQKEADVEDSLLEDAEKVDPAIEKLPAHKTNTKELKKEETLGPQATPEEIHTVDSNKLSQAEKDVDAWNKKHGFTNPKGSLIEAAEEADPAIEKLPPHKTNKKELKEEKTLSADATEEEKEVVETNQFRDMEDEVAAYNKKHGFKNPKGSLLDAAEEADPSIEKLPAHKGQSIDKELNDKAEPSGADVQALPANHPTARHSEIKESLGLATGVPAGRQSIDSGKKSDASDSTKSKDNSSDATKSKDVDHKKSGAGLGAAAVGSNSNSKSLDHDLRKESYDEGYKKGKTDSSSHNRNVSGAAYNTTKPVGDSSNEKSLDHGLKKDLYEHGFRKGKSDHESIGGKLDDWLKKELYDHGYRKGSSEHSNHTGRNIAGGALAGGSTGAALDHGLKKDLYEHGYKKGRSDHESVGQKLDDWLKKELYHHGHKKGTEDHSKHGLYGGIDALDPTLRQQLYEHGKAHGHRVHGEKGSTSGGYGSNLDSKLKQELYEQGYAKGSSNKGATALGAGAGALAGSGAYASQNRHQNEYGQPSERAQLDQTSELVGENTAHKRGQDTQDNLVVEVVGIEDKEEALRTARNASKKLDERGVDLTSGKLIIDANNREIYKEEYVSERELPSQGYAASSAPGTLGQSRAAGFTEGAQDTSYRGDGVGKRTDVVSETIGQTRAAGYAQGSTQPNTHYEGEGVGQRTNPTAGQGAYGSTHGQNATGYNDTSYRGDGTGKRTEVAPETLGQTRAAGFTQGSHQSHPDTQYEGQGVGQRTNLSGDHQANESEIAKQRIHDAARRNAGLTAGASNVNHENSTSKSAPTSKDDEIFVNVKGIKDNNLATKIARAAVARLQKTHGSVISKVKELQVDASSGIVRDENGNTIAKYTDLAVEAQQGPNTTLHGQSGHSGQSTQSGHSGQHGQSGQYGQSSTSATSQGAATTSGALAGSGLAAQAASEASAKHPTSSLTEPTHHTSANTGKYDYASKSSQPPYPQGVPATKEEYGSKSNTYDDSKIHSTGHTNQSSTGYGNTSNTGTGNYSSSSSTSGLPSHSNYDKGTTTTGDVPPSTSKAYESQQQGSTSEGGLSGLASSIIGASGVGGALESLGVTSGNHNKPHDTKTPSNHHNDSAHSSTSQPHLSGANAYPKQAVDAYSSQSKDTSLDKNINDASSSSFIPESGLNSKSIPTEYSSSKLDPNTSNVTASEYLNKDSSNYSSGNTNNINSKSAAHTTNAGTTGSTGIDSTTSAARGSNTSTGFDEANTSSGSFSMPGAWS
ncbi:uncharacterized protein KGF55_001934 [Candida pseudojiufengensis]|uniref:uncharacterized protein n=1 Tax=Candida pseudojiufengensis TaxID=497109 RepID=UPI002225B173|nr:uncharacterized protein KGF55_001934 [Candida pseudojiufengensis]KAI5964863.1 hypothetical protein KGF55_001934 [Candida pseudojiufengensis]